ncbi:MAG: exonuclease domain-containing protein [Eubacteriales bacterium]|nr:exonuclease domain-containing protein [Eubacteriales bacterium]
MIRDYIALDVETTGLNPGRDKVLEIGAVRVRDGVEAETFQTLIDAGTPVPERIQELTGITDEMRRMGRRPEQVYPEFVEFCGDLPVLGHNVQFDFGFLKQGAVNQGLTFEKEALDTLKIARRVLPDLPSRTLAAMCAHYQVDPGSSHRALDDARSAHRVLWKLWEEFGERDPEAFALRRLTYSAKRQSPITNSQKGYLNDLLKYHRIETSICIEDMTRSEASRMIDRIILQYGRISRGGYVPQERKGNEV